MGAGGVASLAFFSHSGPHALARLREELAGRGLRLDDLLRLRVFAADRHDALALEHELEQMFARAGWPALSMVELASSAGGRRRALDAIAAPRAHELRIAIAPRDRRTQPAASAGDRPATDAADRLAAGVGDRPAAGTGDRPAAIRFGPWLFVAALTGASAPGQALAERIEQQSRGLFARMERVLRMGGAELRDVVKLGGWLTFAMSEYEPLAKVRTELLERRGLLPASAAVQVGAIAQDRLLAFDAIAFAPAGAFPPTGGARLDPRRAPVGSARLDRGQARPPAKASPLAGYYASARSAGGYVFACGEIPRSTGALSAQVNDVYAQLRSHLAEHGSSLDRLIHQTVFVRRDEHIAAVEQAIRAALGARMPPTTIVPARDMGFRAGVDVEIEVTAANAMPHEIEVTAANGR